MGDGAGAGGRKMGNVCLLELKDIDVRISHTIDKWFYSQNHQIKIITDRRY